MSNDKKYCLDWCAGPSVQIELFSPADKEGGYQLNYNSSFRGTIRPPVSNLNVGPKDLDHIKEKIIKIIDKMDGILRGDQAEQPQPSPSKDDVLDDMKLMGDELYTFLIQNASANQDLRMSEMYVEIGMDEDLMNFPWELMHDGDDFLCMKHYVGRFVRSTTAQIDAGAMNPTTIPGSSLKDLSILIVSVPRTDPDGETKDYEALPGAEDETDAIFNLLDKMPNVTVKYVKPKDATFDEVYKALKNEKYNILHFCGHAYFDKQHPSRSGLVLRDKIMLTGQVANVIHARKDKELPILCFINACESTRPVDKKANDGERLNIYGLARAFLETGTYLLGSRWRINDKTAKEFATTFYSSLIKDEKSIGKSILDARVCCKKAFPTDLLGWATYIYYGDPRLLFRSITQ